MSPDTMAWVRFRVPMTIDACITPNSRSHWRIRHRLQQDLKAATYYAARNANIEMAGLTPPLHVEMVIAWEKGRRRMDPDNASASTKYIIDGVADALGIDDQYITLGSVDQARDTGGIGFIEVHVMDHVERHDGPHAGEE